MGILRKLIRHEHKDVKRITTLEQLREEILYKVCLLLMGIENLPNRGDVRKAPPAAPENTNPELKAWMQSVQAAGKRLDAMSEMSSNNLLQAYALDFYEICAIELRLAWVMDENAPMMQDVIRQAIKQENSSLQDYIERFYNEEVKRGGFDPERYKTISVSQVINFVDDMDEAFLESRNRLIKKLDESSENVDQLNKDEKHLEEFCKNYFYKLVENKACDIHNADWILNKLHFTE